MNQIGTRLFLHCLKIYLHFTCYFCTYSAAFFLMEMFNSPRSAAAFLKSGLTIFRTTPDVT